MILIIDNYDSFVFNVARYVAELGHPAKVVRNDALTIKDVSCINPMAIILSPGPCGPAQAGISMDIIAAFNGRLPILGICLGHQCVGQAFGGRVVRARKPLHGRASTIDHNRTGLFKGLPEKLVVGRYHSLIVELGDSSPLQVNARSAEGEIMGLAHENGKTFGVQFHPESVLTANGHQLFANFIDIATGKS